MTNKNLYTMHVNKLTLFTHIGITEEERTIKQRLELNLQIKFSNILNSNKKLNFSYSELVENLLEFADVHIFVLLEEFNDQLSQHIFKNFSASESILLESYKFRLFLHTPIEKVGISTYRTRILS